MSPETTAIVLIEYQNDFTSEGGALHEAVKPVMQSTGMLGHTVSLVKQARDQEGAGTDVLITRGLQTATCPVRPMELWLQRSRIAYGAVFPRITAAGTIETRLTDNGVWRILRRRAQQAGLEIPAGERLLPHGMRAGFITEAYLNGALDEQVMAHARQKDVNTTRRYRKRAKTVAASPTRFLDL